MSQPLQVMEMDRGRSSEPSGSSTIPVQTCETKSKREGEVLRRRQVKLIKVNSRGGDTVNTREGVQPYWDPYNIPTK